MSAGDRVDLRPAIGVLVQRLGTEHVLAPLRNQLRGVLLQMEAEARRKAKPHSVDTGTFARSIQSDLTPLGAPLVGRVYSMQRLAPVLEVGRRPGKMPPVAPIARWADKHGIDIPPFVLARAIGRRGTKGLYAFAAAYALAQQQLAGVLRAAVLQIEINWRGKL